MIRILGLGLGLGLLLAGCGGAEGGGEPGPEADERKQDPTSAVCEAGRVVECPCTDGTKGAQTCDDDGGGWGMCVCAPPPPDPSSLVPSDECEEGVGGFSADQACRPAETRFRNCSAKIVESGRCDHTSGNSYCCSN